MHPALQILPLFLSLAQSTEPQASHTDIDRVRERLAFSKSAAFWVEYETRYFSITQAEADAAQAHYDLTKDMCHVEGETDDGGRVAFEGSEIPVSLMNVDTEQVIRNSERIDLAWPWFRIETTADWDADSAGWATLRVHDASGLTVWDRDQGEVTSAERLSVETVWDAEAGSVTLFGRFFRQVSVLLDQAQVEGGLDAFEGGFTAQLSILDPALLDRFESMSLPNGIMVTPGFCELEYRDYGTRSQLELRYRDCFDAQLVAQTVRWEGDEPFPASYEETWWVAGAGALFRHQSVSVARIPLVSPDPQSIRWRGEAGQPVFDHRFGRLHHYRVGERHRGDLAVVVAVDASRNQARGLVEDAGRARLQVTRGPRHFEVRAPGVPGHVMMGSNLRLTLEVENITNEFRTFSVPDPSCGITGLEFDFEDVYGSQMVPIVLDVEVSEPGWNEYVVNIPFFGLSEENSGELEVRLSIFGEDVGSMEPRVQGPWRWCEGDPFPEVACTWRAGVGRVVRPSFATLPLGANLSTQITEGGADLLLSDVPDVEGFGIFPIEIRTQSHPEALMAHEALVLIERVPAALVDDWPTCVRVQSGIFPRVDSFRIPGVAILDAHLIDESDTAPGRTDVDLEIEDGGLRLVERAPSGQRNRLATYRVRLSTDLGPVDLFVYSAPAQTEAMH